MTRTPKISIPLPMMWMKWSIDGSKLLTAFSIFAPPTTAGAQPIITIGSGNCSGAAPGLVAIATEARDDGARLCPDLAVRPEGADYQWRKIAPGELSIDPVADERLVRATARAGAS